MATDQSKPAPPYMSFGVFKSTIDTLAEATVPTAPLDRHVLDGLSGADYGALMSGLKFLGYTDSDRQATKSYRELVEASKDPAQFKALLGDTINAKYDQIIGDLDIQQGSIAQLEKAFKDYGVPAGQMLTKTVRFYVKALRECGYTVSPFILKAKKRAPRTPNGKKAEKNPQTGTTPPGTTVKEAHTPKGFERMPVPGLHDAFIQYPLNITEAHCDLFERVVQVLRTFAKGRSGGKESAA